MNDSSVTPAGLFAPSRQRRLMEALIQRFRVSEQKRQELLKRHTIEREHEEKTLSADRGDVTRRCRLRRREMLGRWDSEEEKLFAQYEVGTIQTRKDIHRLASLFRKRIADETAAIHRKFESRRDAIVQDYESRKHLPGEKNKKEQERIAAALAPLSKQLTAAREVVVGRLDGLPQVKAGDEELLKTAPDSVDGTIRQIEELSRECQDHVAELHAGMVAKLVDSIYLFAVVALLMVAWVVGVVLLSPASFWVVLVAGVVSITVVGLLTYAGLLFPLRAKTRRIYPLIERTGMAANESAKVGRKVSADHAREAAGEMVRHREEQIQVAEKWQADHLAEMKSRLAAEQEAEKQKLDHRLASMSSEFLDAKSKVNTEMHAEADSVAAAITQELTETDQSLDEQRQQNQDRRKQELTRVTDRMRDGVRDGLERIAAICQTTMNRFPDWESLIGQPHTGATEMEFVPLGRLRISEPLCDTLVSREAEADAGRAAHEVAPMFAPDEIPEEIPIALHRNLHSGLIIHAAPEQMDAATNLVQQVLWRMMSGTAGGRTKTTLIDPIGRGQNFTSFMSLTDHDPTLVGHRVWTTENQIEARLGEIAQHAEDVLQSSLRDQFQRVEDYNRIAGSMAEPYRAVAAIGLPEGLTRIGYKHLKALIESGIRCGVFVLMVVSRDQTWSAEQPLPRDHRLLELSVDAAGKWSLEHEGLDTLGFTPDPNVPGDLRAKLSNRIGRAAVEAARVEVPLESLLKSDDGGDGSTDDGIEITIGSQGGKRTVSLLLGEGVRQHVLIAGKTGSGKSTLLHAIITSGAHQYTPDQLEYYLLDFKKGVEFKAYADAAIPHARVIGIESEREFGRSVLQRLDEELQQRGELFRGVSAQELSEYRHASGKAMPRILLVVDEFQELFIRDDRVAADCAMLLDRLVRQGRSFGIHVILSSQSLAGAYSLPRATLGQMAVRIAMQCSESDAALILADDNTAARLINRPGEAIYNDAGGLVEGNQPFQVAWLSNERHDVMLRHVSRRDADTLKTLPPPVIFQGNRPCQWTPVLASSAVGDAAQQHEELHGLLGEAVEIGPPIGLQLSRNAGRNVLMIPSVEARAGLLSSVVSGFARSNPELEVIYFNGNRASESPSLAPWLQQAGVNAKEVGPRDSEAEILSLVELVKERGDEAEGVPPIVLVFDPLDRFRDFRHDDAYTFSLDGGGGMSAGQAFREVLKDGPPAHIYSLLVCGGAEIVNRWLPRQSQHDVELRVIGRLNASDSSLLLDSPIAAELSAATMLLYDESAGRISKFRQPDQPEPDAVKQWLG
ncbi:MAG: FtsK/SpoIIIE domain-containing protein [Planctomycetota bacterium]